MAKDFIQKAIKKPGALRKSLGIKKGKKIMKKKVPAGKKGKGLRKLPKKVRNKMGFMKKGGKVK